ncbi:MAG: (d)CMP kinase [Bdellovibrionaceae bacterium]|nr:(d)CMP kinase [Pseudobdellovibrionaceae bacterium]
MGQVVTIDGPAASGKSSVSRDLARRLGWRWVSTGAFYRGLAYVAQQMNVDLDDARRLGELAHSKEWEVLLDPERTSVLFRGQDVTQHIFAEDVGGIASKISHYPEVREALLGAQRACAEGPDGLVAEGRDCGTVVFPGAPAKIYLTASSESRAARRAAEEGADPNSIIEAQKVRDQQDSTRKNAPLSVPKEALVLDTSTLNLDQVVDQVEAFARRQLKL